MNFIFHFLFNYLMIDVVLTNSWNHIILIFILSVFIDIDHVPYLIRAGKNVLKKRFGSESRTRFHEIYGLAFFSLLLCALYFFADHAIIEISAICVVMHLAIDFLTGKSAPFHPYSKNEIFLNIFPYGYKNKIIFEISSTIILGVLFWLRISPVWL